MVKKPHMKIATTASVLTRVRAIQVPYLAENGYASPEILFSFDCVQISKCEFSLVVTRTSYLVSMCAHHNQMIIETKVRCELGEVEVSDYSSQTKTP